MNNSTVSKKNRPWYTSSLRLHWIQITTPAPLSRTLLTHKDITFLKDLETLIKNEIQNVENRTWLQRFDMVSQPIVRYSLSSMTTGVLVSMYKQILRLFWAFYCVTMYSHSPACRAQLYKIWRDFNTFQERIMSFLLKYGINHVMYGKYEITMVNMEYIISGKYGFIMHTKSGKNGNFLLVLIQNWNFRSSYIK